MSDKEKSKVRFGVIGVGNMGNTHARNLARGDVPGAALGAVCDVDSEKGSRLAAELGVKHFASHRELLASRAVDAIIIAVPHYDHVPIAIDAFDASVHVMCEKPIAVSVTDARKVNAAYAKAAAKNAKLKFGIMFQARTNPAYKRLRDVISGGELGEITRITWVATAWFRTNAYYGSGGWRATWKGEGGGVLINQCPHNLDMIQWATGLMPSRITAVGFIGKRHPIEVEDEVSAILEYPNGAVGHFITTTAEYPGTNRLEVAGDRGKIVAEGVQGGKITFHRTLESVSNINETTTQSFPTPETWTIDIPVPPGGESHNQILARFVEVIQQDRPNADLIAQGTEGINGLEIGNAMLMSALTRKPVDLPVDGAAFDAFLLDMHATHGGRKRVATTNATPVDFSASFAR